MITYISLLIAALSSVAGLYVQAKKKNQDGTEERTPWFYLFLALPIVALIAGAANTWLTDRSSQRKAAEQQASEKDLRKTIRSLQDNIQRLKNRVELIQIKYVYSFRFSEGDVPVELKKMLNDWFDFDAITIQDKDGSLRTAFSSDLIAITDDHERQIFNLVDRYLNGIRGVQRPTLFFADGKSVGEDLQMVLRSHITFTHPGFVIDGNLPQGVWKLALPNPQGADQIRPISIRQWKSQWYIPDIHASDPELQIIWTYQLFTSQGSGFEYVDDFRHALISPAAPRFDPNLDASPGAAFYRKPFGHLAEIQVDAGRDDLLLD